MLTGMADGLGALGMPLFLVPGAGMVATVVMPRGRSPLQLIGATVTRTVRAAVILVSQAFKDFEHKDAVLATIGPLAMLTQLLVFLGLFLIGYGVAMAPYSHSFHSALEQAGACEFTVGLARAGRGRHA